jgi:3-alpha domain
MAALLTGHGRPGFYLRVLQPGEVGAEDEITFLGGADDRLAVRQISDLLYKSHDEQTLRRALSLTALPDGWRTSFQALLDQSEQGLTGNAGLAGPSTPPAWSGFREFRVTDVVTKNPTVRSFVFVPADGVALASHLPGQFVSIRLPERDGRRLVRSYSLSAIADSRSLRISVRRDGDTSTQLHDTSATDARARWSAASSPMTLTRSTPPRPAMLCCAARDPPAPSPSICDRHRAATRGTGRRRSQRSSRSRCSNSCLSRCISSTTLRRKPRSSRSAASVRGQHKYSSRMSSSARTSFLRETSGCERRRRG